MEEMTADIGPNLTK